MNTHRALTGRVHDLRGLTGKERTALAELRRLHAHNPTWDEFARRWPTILREQVWGGGPVPVGSTLYRVAQDLEARLGIAQGRMGPPSLRGRIVDLIEGKFGSRYAFCKATGIDQGNLSHVFAGRKEFSLQALERIFEALGVQLGCVPVKEVEREARALACNDGTEELRDLTLRIATLDDLAAKAGALPRKQRASLVPDGDPRAPDDLDDLRARLAAGERFEAALAAELASAYEAQATLALRIARAARAKARRATEPARLPVEKPRTHRRRARTLEAPPSPSLPRRAGGGSQGRMTGGRG